MQSMGTALPKEAYCFSYCILVCNLGIYKKGTKRGLWVIKHKYTLDGFIITHVVPAYHTVLQLADTTSI